jgi:hypothetical protein
MSPRKKTRNLKRRFTPKGEAKNALEHSEACLPELEATSNSGEKETFVRRFNEFLANARKVPDFLPKETGRAVGLKTWAKKQQKNLERSDQRYKYFCALRRISTHDCIVQPDTAQQSVEITNQLRFSGHFDADLRDPTGRVTARATYDGPVGAESVHEETKVRTKYFFNDWQKEDIVTFAKEILDTLRGLVNRAYRLFP